MLAPSNPIKMRGIHFASMLLICISFSMSVGLAVYSTIMYLDSSGILKPPLEYKSCAIYQLLWVLLSSIVLTYYIVFMKWRETWDRHARSTKGKFYLLIFVWGVFLLGNIVFGLFMVGRTATKHDLAKLYQIFSESNRNANFAQKFQSFQEDHACCGVYGPEDWLMVKLRQNMLFGNNGYQSMDYGFGPSITFDDVLNSSCPQDLEAPINGCGKLIYLEINKGLTFLCTLIFLQSFIGIFVAASIYLAFLKWVEIVVPNYMSIGPTPRDCQLNNISNSNGYESTPTIIKPESRDENDNINQNQVV